MTDLNIGLILPDVLGTYGDDGNALVLRERARRRGFDATVTPIKLGEPVPEGLDVYAIGGGEDAAQTIAAEHLLICNNHTGFLAFRMFSAVCCGVWLELSNQKPIRGVVCILLNTNSMYTERYKEWEGFRRSWHCRKIQKFRFSHNAYLLVFGSE